jgi:hypothetical protein
LGAPILAIVCSCLTLEPLRNALGEIRLVSDILWRSNIPWIEASPKRPLSRGSSHKWGLVWYSRSWPALIGDHECDVAGVISLTRFAL